MHDDLVAIYSALRGRGLGPEEILSLDGELSRHLILRFLQAAGERIASWPDGQVLLHYSGHGAFWPWDADGPSQARPALLPENDSEQSPASWVFWDEVFAILRPPAGVQLTLLPDC